MLLCIYRQFFLYDRNVSRNKTLNRYLRPNFYISVIELCFPKQRLKCAAKPFVGYGVPICVMVVLKRTNYQRIAGCL